MPQYLSLDPNFGNEDYISNDPNFGDNIPPSPTLPELPSPFKTLPKVQPTVDPGFTPFAPDFNPLRRSVGENAGNFIAGGLSGPMSSDQVWNSPYGKAGAILGSTVDAAGLATGAIAGKRALQRLISPAAEVAQEIKPVASISNVIDKTIPAAESPIKITPIEQGWQVGKEGEKLPLPAKLEMVKDIPKLEKPIKSPITIPEIPKVVEDPKSVIVNWNNRRKASDLAGQSVKEQFSRLDSEGMDAIKNIESGDPAYKDVRDYLDTAYTRAKDSFSDIRYRSNYLPLLFNNSKKEVDAAFEGTHLTTNPGFTLKRTLDDYQAGIDAGLTPKFNKVSDILGWYEQALVKGGEDRKLFTYLKSNKLISTKPKDGWDYLDPTLFPKAGGQGQGRVYYAPKQVASDINTILRPNNGVLAKIAKPFAWSKSMALTGGVPNTGLNWHGTVNIPWRAATSTGINQALKTYLYDFRPSAAEKFLTVNRSKSVDAVNHGLTLGAEGFWAGQGEKLRPTNDLTLTPVKRLVNQGLNAANHFEKWFADPTFKKIIPAVKLESWDKITQQFIKSGMAEKEAKTSAAQFVNNSYGGLNNPTRNKDLQNISQIFFLAPDWLETKYQLAKGSLRALKDPTSPVGQKYLKTSAKMAVLLASTNLMRRAITGKDAPTSGRVGNIPIPSLNQSGKRANAEADPFGAAFDTVELPMRMANEIRKGKSPLPVLGRFGRSNLSTGGQYLANQVTGSDMLGRPVYQFFGNNSKFGSKVSNNDIVKNAISEIINLWLPQNIQAPIDYATGRISGPESTAQALELPVRWYRP